MEEVDQTPHDGTEQAPVAAPTAEETVQTPPAEPAQPAEVTHEDPQPSEVSPVEAPQTDYQEKFRQSSSEALILNARNKQQADLLNKLTTQDSPTEAEILAEYPDYPRMDATSQKFILNLMTTNKRQLRQERLFAEQEADRQWQAELRSLTSEATYASLAKDPGFDAFVFQPKHKGLDIRILADAYLLRTGKTTEEAPAQPVQRTEALPAGSGGPRQKATRPTYKASELNALRQTNYRAWVELNAKIDPARDIVEG